jgi:hypothetical protein
MSRVQLPSLSRQLTPGKFLEPLALASFPGLFPGRERGSQMVQVTIYHPNRQKQCTGVDSLRVQVYHLVWLVRL